METLNSIGFVNFWGMTPAFDILNNEYDSTKKSINTLISNSNDIRHILKTISNSYEKKDNFQQNTNLNFYVYETFKENHARTILLFHILHDRSVAIRDRVEILMEVYGNTLLSSRTAEYINNSYKELLKFITNNYKYSAL